MNEEMFSLCSKCEGMQPALQTGRPGCIARSACRNGGARVERSLSLVSAAHIPLSSANRLRK
jgi:hypothetical protein